VKIRYIAGVVAVTIIGLWITGAAKGGYFILDRHEYVPATDDAAIDTFSQRKKTIEIEGLPISTKAMARPWFCCMAVRSPHGNGRT